MTYSTEAMGLVIRAGRNGLASPMSQAAFGEAIGYGSGAGVAVSRVERGITNPGEAKLVAIADIFGITVEELKERAIAKTEQLKRGGGGQKTEPPKVSAASLKHRYEAVTQTVAHRTETVQNVGESFEAEHSNARDQFFMKFVLIAESIHGGPVPPMPSHSDLASEPKEATAIQIDAMKSGIAEAIRGAAGGAATGAAAGGAAAYAAFTAAAAFGTASTGTAIGTLSGIAATNATWALLGGGTLAAGGAGVAGGMFLLGGVVAAPVAILGAAGLILNRRRTKKQEAVLSAQLDEAEQALRESEPGFEALIELLSRGATILNYVTVHGTHALERWHSSLPTPTRNWEDLTLSAQEDYNKLLTAAACVSSISILNGEALLTANGERLREICAEYTALLDHADTTIREQF